MSRDEQFRDLSERARALGLEVMLALVPKDVKKGELLRVKAPKTETDDDLGKSLDIIEGHIGTAEIAADIRRWQSIQSLLDAIKALPPLEPADEEKSA